MKTLNLIIPDSTYDLALQRAKAEGMDPAFYCSTLLTERLNQDFQRPTSNRPVQKTTQSLVGSKATLSIGRKLPDTIEQIFAVCRHVWQDKMEYSEAVNKVSRDLCIQETTVRDKCTRRICLPNSPVNTDRFLNLLAHPNSLVEHLCRRFSRFSAEIHLIFEPILPTKN
jgi:hypothetical protein